jgi:hypothetical protein
LLLLDPDPDGKSCLHIERRKPNLPFFSFALGFIASGRAVLFKRTMRKRRSSRRLFQESWPIYFEGFPASAYTRSGREKAGFQTRHFSRIKCCPRNAESTRRAITACPKREASSCRAARFSRSSGKRGHALWDSGPGPEGDGHESVCTRGKLHRRQRLCARISGERSIHGKNLFGAVRSRLARPALELPGFDRGTRPATFDSCVLRNRFDYIFISKSLQRYYTGGRVFRKGLSGSRGKRPTLWERYPAITASKEGASDHSAVVIELNI